MREKMGGVGEVIFCGMCSENLCRGKLLIDGFIALFMAVVL